VGDAGIAIERGSEITRLLWCDIQELKIQGGDLLAKSEALTLGIPIGAHPRAVAFINRGGGAPPAQDREGE